MPVKKKTATKKTVKAIVAEQPEKVPEVLVEQTPQVKTETPAESPSSVMEPKVEVTPESTNPEAMPQSQQSNETVISPETPITPLVEHANNTVGNPAVQFMSAQTPTEVGASASEGDTDNKKKIIVLFIVALLVGALGGGGYYFFFWKKADNKPLSPVKIVQPAPKAEPIASPAAETVDLTKYTISVLNGSGITGEAAKVKDMLTTDGFKVSSTGNAETSDFTVTQIAAKKAVADNYLKKLTDDLAKTYKLASSSGTLAESKDTDVEITIGSSKATP